MIDESSALLVNEEARVEPRSYARRWIMLLLFIFMAFCSFQLFIVENCPESSILATVSYERSRLASWISFTNITVLTAEYYNVTDNTIEWLNLLYPALEMPGLLLTVYLLQTRGLRFVLFAGAVLQLIGAWVRYFGSRSNRLWALFIGQGFFGLAVPVVDASPTYIANTWFREDQRGTAVAIFVVGISISLALISFLVPLLVDTFTKLQLLILVTAGIVTVSSSLNMFFQQDKPPTPPSVSAQVERVGFKESILTIWKNLSFIILATSWGAAFGAYQAFLAMASPLTQPQYTPEETGIFTAGVMVAGLCGTITAGVAMDKFKAFKILILLGAGGFVITVGAQTLLMAPGRFYILLVIFCIQGFFGFMTYPTALEMGAELTFPIPEQYSASVLTLSSDAWTVGITYLAQYINGHYGVKATWWTLTAFAIAAAIGLAFVQPDYKRLEFEKNNKAFEESAAK